MKFDYQYLHNFQNEMAVVCPNCHSKARVIAKYTIVYEARFVCPNCAMNRIWGGDAYSFTTAHTVYKNETGILVGPPVDSFFKYPLWYQTPYKSEVLYAYNLAHLHFLKSYVSADLRERLRASFDWSNSSIQSRLPKWLLAARHRATIIKKLSELERK